jgi:hypothetical protein
LTFLFDIQGFGVGLQIDAFNSFFVVATRDKRKSDERLFATFRYATFCEKERFGLNRRDDMLTAEIREEVAGSIITCIKTNCS